MPLDDRIELSASSQQYVKAVEDATVALSKLVGEELKFERAAVRFNDAGEAQIKSITVLADETKRLTVSYGHMEGELRPLSASLQNVNKKLEDHRIALEGIEATKRRLSVLDFAQSAGRLLPFDSGPRVEDASTVELFNFKREAEKLSEIAIKHNLTVDQIQKMWDELASGKVKAYHGALGELQAQVLRLQQSKQQLGLASDKLHQDEVSRLVREGQLRKKIIAEGNAAATEAAANYTRLISEQQKILDNANRAEMARIFAEANFRRRVIAENNASVNKQIADVERLHAAQQRQFDALVKQSKPAEQAILNIHLGWKQLLRLVTVHVTYSAIFSLIQSLREAGEEAVKLSLAIARIQTIDDARGSTDAWSASLRRLSDSFGIPILDQAEGAYQTLSNQIVEGVGATERFLETVNKLAISTGSTTSEASNAITSIINAYGLSVEDAEEISAKLFKTVDLGRLVLSDIADSIGTVAVVANQLGISLEEMLAFLDLLTIKGIAPAVAMTQLRGVMNKLTKPTEDMLEFLKTLGFQSGEAATQTLGFFEVMRKLFEFTKGSSTELAELFNNMRGFTGAVTLGADQLKQYTEFLEKTKEPHAAYDRAVKLTTESVGKRWEKAGQQITNAIREDIIKQKLDFLDKFVGFDNLAGSVIGLAKALDVLLIPAISVVIARLIAMATVAATGEKSVKALGASLLKNPFFLVAAGALAIIEVFDAISTSSDEATVKIANNFDKWDKEFSKVITVAEKGNNEIVKALERTVTQIDNLTGRLGFRLTEIFAEDFNSAIEIYEEMAESIDEVNDEIVDSFKDQVKDLESDYKKLLDIIDDQKEALKDLELTSSSKLFDIKIGGLDPAAQADAIEKRINDLQSQAAAAATAGDVERLEALQKEIESLFEERMDILTGLVEESTNKIADSLERLREKEADLIQERERLVRDVKQDQREGKDVSQSDRDKLQDIDAEFNKIQQQKAELLKKEQEIAAATRGKLNFEQQYVNLVAREKTLREQIIAAQEAEAIKTQTALDEKKAVLETLEQLSKDVAEFDLDAFEEASAPEDIEKILQDQRLALDSLGNLLVQLGEADAAAALFEQRVKLEEAAAARIKQLKIDAELEAIQIARQRAQQEILTAQTRLETEQEISNEQQRNLQLAKEVLDQYANLFGDLLDFEIIKERLQGPAPSPFSNPEPSKITTEHRDALKALEEFFANPSTANATTALEKLESIIERLTNLQTVKTIGEEPTFDDENLNNMLEYLQNAVESLQQAVETPIADRADLILELQTSLNKATEKLHENEAKLLQLSNEFFGDVVTAERDNIFNFRQAIEEYSRVVDKFSNTIDQLGRSNQRSTGGLISYFAEGGLAKGTDRIPAMLSDGEFVVNKESTRKFYSQLVSMNRGMVPDMGRLGSVDVGGINVSVDGASKHNVRDIAREVVSEINLGLRSGTFRFHGSRNS